MLPRGKQVRYDASDAQASGEAAPAVGADAAGGATATPRAEVGAESGATPSAASFETGPAGSLVQWLQERRLLRGPYLFVDYWASVLGLGGIVAEEPVRRGIVDLRLFRLGVDRPELEVPRLRYYLLLFLVGPFLLPFRRFRRLGRYRFRLPSKAAEAALDALQAHRLELTPAGPGRVDVSWRDVVLARGILDPNLVSGFSSVFWAAYRLPLAALSATVAVAVLTPILDAAGLLGVTTAYWIPVGFPVLILGLYAIYRDWGTAVLGALPVVLGRYLLVLTTPAISWAPFFASLVGLFLLYLLVDWFFMPRPVPPALLLYVADGPGKPYARPGDEPYWLEGRAYWVWRYLILSPAELNKFWEKDWERVELWIRADGPAAGTLEWVVTDLHYRELWTPYDRLGSPRSLERDRREALDAARRCHPGLWLLEVDADLIFHYPYFRGVSFLPEEGSVPAQGIGHVATALWRRAEEDDIERYLDAIDHARVRTGIDILADLPEFIARRAARHLVTQPWRYWRYPLGAATRRERRLYGMPVDTPPPPLADPALQIKAP